MVSILCVTGNAGTVRDIVVKRERTGTFIGGIWGGIFFPCFLEWLLFYSHVMGLKILLQTLIF